MQLTPQQMFLILAIMVGAKHCENLPPLEESERTHISPRVLQSNEPRKDFWGYISEAQALSESVYTKGMQRVEDAQQARRNEGEPAYISAH